MAMDRNLSALTADKTLILLHPADYHNHRFMTQQLLLNHDSSVYLHVPCEESAQQSDFMLLLRETLSRQADIHVAELPENPEQAATALAKALNPKGNFRLAIDGYDRVSDSSIHDFILNLVDKLENGCQVVVSGRDIPSGLIRKHDPRSVMLPTSPDEMIVDYINTKPDKTVIEVRALGGGQAFINGQALDKWDGVLPRCLFFYLVDRAMVTRDNIFATFWPTLKKREATNVFHVTKRKISEILGYDLTTYASGFYRLADDIELHYDVVSFQEAAQNAIVEEDAKQAAQLYKTAIKLYRGPFLKNMEQTWVTQRREDLHSIFVECLTGLARICETEGQIQEALNLYIRAWASTPEREDLTRRIMTIYRDMGQTELALSTYHKLENELQSNLQLEPSAETLALADDIKNIGELAV